MRPERTLLFLWTRLRFDPATDTTNTHWYHFVYTPGAGHPAPGPGNPWRSQPACPRSPVSRPMDILVEHHSNGFAPAYTGHGCARAQGNAPRGHHPLQRQNLMSKLRHMGEAGASVRATRRKPQEPS